MIDQNFRNQNCDDIIAAVRLHGINPPEFLLRLVDRPFPLDLDAFCASCACGRESEVVAYGAEKEF